MPTEDYLNLDYEALRREGIWPAPEIPRPPVPRIEMYADEGYRLMLPVHCAVYQRFALERDFALGWDHPDAIRAYIAAALPTVILPAFLRVRLVDAGDGRPIMEVML